MRTRWIGSIRIIISSMKTVRMTSFSCWMRPDHRSNLTDQFSGWVIPADTIRKVKENGLITGAIYRPSRATKVKYLASLLSRSDRKIALAMARGEREPDRLLKEDIDPRTKILISDLAARIPSVPIFQERDRTRWVPGTFLENPPGSKLPGRGGRRLPGSSSDLAGSGAPLQPFPPWSRGEGRPPFRGGRLSAGLS